MRAGPDTVGELKYYIPFDHFGGYYYPDPYIRCISHTHMVGSGIVDLGTIGVMPLARLPTVADITLEGYASTFSHANESGSPGYYSVFLQTPAVRVEVTATEQAAVHRYTYSGPTSPRVVLFPISHAIEAAAAAQAEIFVNTKGNEVHGWMLLKGGLSGRFGGYKSFFSAKFSSPFTSYGTWSGSSLSAGTTKTNGTKPSGSAVLNLGAYIAVGSGSSPLEFTIGISSISVDQARLNIAKQVGNPARSFSAVWAETQQIWESQLSRISIQTSTSPQEELIKFYSALYHTLAAPTLFSESGGSYLGFDNKVHNVAEKPGQVNYYTDMSIWDVHRTEFPWLNIFRPDVMSDVVQSLLRMYEQGGELPRWPFLNGYTGCMIGTHAIIVIVDAFLKNVTNGLDINEAYTAMVSAATQPQKYAGRDDLQGYLSRGWVAFDVNTISASETMEYAYDDATLGNFAAAIGQTTDAAVFSKRGLNYKNVWDSQQQHMCGRLANGQFNCPLSYLYTFDERYVEGDGEQWRWFVPHDTPGLISLFGSNNSFVQSLDEFIDYSRNDPYNILPNPWYWAGNEPDIFAPWMFNYAGRADLTQKWTRWLILNKYSAQPDGIPGNDDYGTMSAWYIFGALGFYPVSGSTRYLVGAPLFEKVVMSRPQGPLTIIANNAAPKNCYVQKATVNGAAIDMINAPWFEHAQIASGGAVLEFWMTPNPP